MVRKFSWHCIVYLMGSMVSPMRTNLKLKFNIEFRLAFLVLLFCGCSVTAKDKLNVLFIISDDLTSTALSCYGNTVCKTPNIDSLAERGTRFTRAYCQGTYCGPSRASFMSGYYPHATGALGYKSPRPQIGNRVTWSQHFKNNGYYSARVSKIYHMGVPGGIESGGHGADDEASWTERFNSKGPEWRAPGDGETLQNNPDGKKPAVGGNTFVVVEADGDDLVHSDGKTAKKAVELIHQRKDKDEPFWLGVGFVRPHVPFVAPRSYYPPFKPYSKMVLPPKIPGDWDDIPKAGINYCTSSNMKMDIRRQKKSVGGYYASVAYMDAQVGKVLTALDEAGLRDNTIVIFTSDHGFHLGEHDFWAKVSLLDESSQVPLIISVPGKAPSVCHSLTELLDLYPTISSLCGLPTIFSKPFAVDVVLLNPDCAIVTSVDWSPIAKFAAALACSNEIVSVPAPPSTISAPAETMNLLFLALPVNVSLCVLPSMLMKFE